MPTFLRVAAVIIVTFVGACSSTRHNTGFAFEPRTPHSFGRTMQVDVNSYLEGRLCGTTPLANHPEQRRAIDCVSGEGQAEFQGLIALIATKPSLTDSDRAGIRNDVLTQLIAASDNNCTAYLFNLRGTQVGNRILGDIFTATFGLAGSLNDHERTGQALSALSALSTVVTGSVDRSAFAETGMELIAEEIIKLRDRQRAVLTGKMNTAYRDYDVGLAIADVANYHRECSIMRGMSTLRQAVQSRDEAIRLSRQAALRVNAAGGTGAEVAAAVGGVAEVYLGLDDETQTPEQIAPNILRRAPDLEALQRAAIRDIPETIDAGNFSSTVSAVVRALTGTENGNCQTARPATIEWNKRLLAAARDQLCKFGPNVNTNYVEAGPAVRDAVENAVQQNISARVRAVEFARDLGQQRASKAAVVAAITAIRANNDLNISGDPMFAIMIAAANSVEGDNGLLAANVAIGSGAAYLATIPPQPPAPASVVTR